MSSLVLLFVFWDRVSFGPLLTDLDKAVGQQPLGNFCLHLLTLGLKASITMPRFKKDAGVWTLILMLSRRAHPSPVDLLRAYPPTTSIFKDQICDWIRTDWNFLENKGNKPKTQTEKLSAQRDVPREKIEGRFSLSFGKFVRSHQTSYKHGTCFCENFTESPAFFIFFRGDLTLQPGVALTLLCTYLRLVLNSGSPLEPWGYRQVFAILAWAC